MSKIIHIVGIGLFVFIILGCSSINKTASTEGSTAIQTTEQSAYPFPIDLPSLPLANSSYPGPGSSGEVSTLSPTPVYFVTQMAVPTPMIGKAVITGQLFSQGSENQPFITSIYLSSTSPSTTPGGPPEVNFSEQSDPIAIQDLGTGRFMFQNVDPGQYSIVIWSQNGGIPLLDESGNTIIFTVNSDETKDLGVIHVP